MWGAAGATEFLKRTGSGSPAFGCRLGTKVSGDRSALTGVGPARATARAAVVSRLFPSSGNDECNLAFDRAGACGSDGRGLTLAAAGQSATNCVLRNNWMDDSIPKGSSTHGACAWGDDSIVRPLLPAPRSVSVHTSHPQGDRALLGACHAVHVDTRSIFDTKDSTSRATESPATAPQKAREALPYPRRMGAAARRARPEAVSAEKSAKVRWRAGPKRRGPSEVLQGVGRDDPLRAAPRVPSAVAPGFSPVDRAKTRTVGILTLLRSPPSQLHRHMRRRPQHHR